MAVDGRAGARVRLGRPAQAAGQRDEEGERSGASCRDFLIVLSWVERTPEAGCLPTSKVRGRGAPGQSLLNFRTAD